MCNKMKNQDNELHNCSLWKAKRGTGILASSHVKNAKICVNLDRTGLASALSSFFYPPRMEVQNERVSGEKHK